MVVRTVCLAVVAAWSASDLLAPVSAAQPAQRYNLLVVQTDEHHFGTLGCYGGSIVGTPHIDAIAHRGALCSSFYATTPVCSPSRAALVSGLYPQKTPVVTNNIPLDDGVVTFAELLRRQGYATGYAGKWHLDGAGKPQWAPRRKFGFEDNRFMFNRGHWKKLIDTPDGPRVGSRNRRGRPDYGLAGADSETFTTDWLCNKAIDFIRKNRERPFCYMISIPDPHGPNRVRAPYDTMYSGVDVPIPASLRKRPQQAPRWGRPADVTAAQLRQIMPAYYGMVKCIDDNVGRIVATLRSEGVLDRTVMVFTSDHGDLCGEHGRLNKGVPYEASARIPFLICCPDRIPPGTVVTAALSCVDFLPTVMSLLEVPVEHAVDGRNAAPLLMGQEHSWHDVTFLRSTSSREPWLCVVTSRYKLVYAADDVAWLIDVQEDPQELTNIAAGEEFQPLVRQLTRELLNYAQAHQDPYARVPGIQAAMQAVLQ